MIDFFSEHINIISLIISILSFVITIYYAKKSKAESKKSKIFYRLPEMNYWKKFEGFIYLNIAFWNGGYLPILASDIYTLGKLTIKSKNDKLTIFSELIYTTSIENKIQLKDNIINFECLDAKDGAIIQCKYKDRWYRNEDIYLDGRVIQSGKTVEIISFKSLLPIFIHLILMGICLIGISNLFIYLNSVINNTNTVKFIVLFVSFGYLLIVLPIIRIQDKKNMPEVLFKKMNNVNIDDLVKNQNTEIN